MEEEDLLPISALQHLLFCERQCALIHLERIWAENPLTLEGRHLHERVDEGPGESRGDLRWSRFFVRGRGLKPASGEPGRAGRVAPCGAWIEMNAWSILRNGPRPLPCAGAWIET
jgi:hypothetical protein